MSAAAPQTTAAPVFEIKGDSFTLPTLCLLEDDLDALDQQLAAKISQAPEFFKNAPVVLDLAAVPQLTQDSEFAFLIGLVRGYDMLPIAVRNASEAQLEVARLMELAVLHDARDFKVVKSKPEPDPPSQDDQAAPPEPPSPLPNQVMEQAVRSGQRIYAQGASLTLLGPVSSGAEIMADGDIHAYAPVRGRIMAGVQGNEQARIFCDGLGAELVSIAGRYKVNEDLDPLLVRSRVQVSLDGDRLLFEPF